MSLQVILMTHNYLQKRSNLSRIRGLIGFVYKIDQRIKQLLLNLRFRIRLGNKEAFETVSQVRISINQGSIFGQKTGIVLLLVLL